MNHAFFQVPVAINEPVKDYSVGSEERKSLQKELKQMKGKTVDIPMCINGKDITTNNKVKIHPPHEINHTLGYFNMGDASHIKEAINSALKAKKNWAETGWEDRAAIFLKAAELIAGPYRNKINAATMLGQGKNVYQAEIDASCELIDFLRFNVQYMTDIYAEQPESSSSTWNKLSYRPLEGFIFALTPFNFTAIAANLCAAPALMGNVIVWKPSRDQAYSANIIMEVFKEAGLPNGVINLVFCTGAEAGDIIFKHPSFSGLHFTGSTEVFKSLWSKIGKNINCYNTYPRIVGETGGKDFIVAHPSANSAEVATSIVRGAFEFQGQKCSAASRVYLPNNLSAEILTLVKNDLKEIKMGSPEDFSNFINAVINEQSFDKIASYIDFVKSANDAEIIAGGGYDKSKGYFIEPTVVLTNNPKFKTLSEEIFGPVVTIYVYDKNNYEDVLDLIDKTSEYALTGAVFSKCRVAIRLTMEKLRNSAGNFYINDKPTGAVVGQQPFGGARGSGTNDKAGSYLNLIRWVSPLTVKETFVPSRDYTYPFLES